MRQPVPGAGHTSLTLRARAWCELSLHSLPPSLALAPSRRYDDVYYWGVGESTLPIVGDVALRDLVVVFDLDDNKVGFADAVCDDDDGTSAAAAATTRAAALAAAAAATDAAGHRGGAAAAALAAVAVAGVVVAAVRGARRAAAGVAYTAL